MHRAAGREGKTRNGFNKYSLKVHKNNDHGQVHDVQVVGGEEREREGVRTKAAKQRKTVVPGWGL